jgi:lipooligosaccharide transport system permease protein
MATTAAAPGLGLRVLPPILAGRRAARLIERNALVYRRMWLLLVSGFFEPLFYLLSISVGIGKLAGPIPGPRGQLVGYTVFAAPALLASAAMNGAIFDSTFGVFFKLKFAKVYDAVLATPLGVTDVAVGEIGWAVIRGGLYSIVFLVVMAALGLVQSPWALLALPSALLLSLAFSALGMAATTFMRSWQDFDFVQMTTLPMFLFSATFYPLSTYPGALRLVVRLTPLYQGVALLRGLDLGDPNWAMLGHVAYLVGMAAVGLAVTTRRLGRLLLH